MTSFNKETDLINAKIFSVDYSKRGTAKCKNCKKVIAKGLIRLGKEVPFKVGYIIQYFHIDCAFESFQKARSITNTVTNLNDIGGIDFISADEKSKIVNLIDTVNSERFVPLPMPVIRKVKKLVQSTPHLRKSQLKPSNLPSMKILFTNADQLTTSKMIELKSQIADKKPLLVAVSEVKHKKSNEWSTMDYDIPGYTLYSVNLDNDTGRGIAVYSHESIDKSVTQIHSHLNFEETCLMEIRLRGGDTLLFACCYRSPTRTATSDQNNEKLNRLLEYITNNKYSHKCIVGDFNYRDINWSTGTTSCSENSIEAKFIETIRNCYLHQHVEKATRKRGNDDPSLLDLILTDEEMQVSDVSHLSPLGKSDHSVMTFNYHCYLDYTKPKESYHFPKGDYISMRNDLVNSNWIHEYTDLADQLTVEDLWLSLKGKLIELRKKFVPKQVSSNKPSWKMKGSYPINKITQQALKDKKRAYRAWMRTTNTRVERESARLTYTKKSNKAKTMLRRAKKSHERNIAEQAKTNPKAFWSHARRKLKTKSGVAPLLSNPKDPNSLKFKDEEKANILQQQFSNVFTREPNGDIPTIESKSNISISDMHVTENMVCNELKKLNPNKSCGPDDIHPRMLIEIAELIAGPITLLLNRTVEQSTLPHDWKQAFISPIYKKGSKSNAENYRPISLTSVICKIMESFVREKVMTHLREHELLSNVQYGFISGRSTTTQLLNYIDKCINIIADGGVVDAIYFDFAKAFDSVPHRRLIGKLLAYGIRGTILDWIKEFLSDRSQVVKVNGASSEIAAVLSGIPQGTVLGPLLFVLYINDILENVKSNGFLYADDTKIFHAIRSREDADILQLDINALEDWSRKWLLQFHPDKCNVVTLGKFENIQYTKRYSICLEEMDHVFEVKDLGVIVDSELSFEEHISNKIQKANAIVGLIRRSFTHLDHKSFKKLFTAFVRPHLEYAQSVWAPYLKKYINQIENVQARATKLVDNLSNLEYPERLKRLNLPTLAFRRLRGDMIEVYKHFHVYDQSTISRSFQPQVRPSRKHHFQLLNRRAKDGARGIQTNSFYFRIAEVWNELPKTVVNANNVNEFKNKLDEHWKDKSIKFDHTLSTQSDS